MSSRGNKGAGTDSLKAGKCLVLRVFTILLAVCATERYALVIWHAVANL